MKKKGTKEIAIPDMMSLSPLALSRWSEREEESHDVVGQTIQTPPMNQAEKKRSMSTASAKRRSMSWLRGRLTKHRSTMNDWKVP